MTASQATVSGSTPSAGNRWVILFFSILSMVAVANFQYGWTLFVAPLGKHLGAERAAIQVTFTVFVLLETWLVPFEGWLVDTFGPRLLVMVGGVLAGLGWVGSGKAESLTSLYLSYALSGIGAGIVYGTAVGSALKWFPDHRGLAAGLTAAGFGAGAAFTVAPIANMIDKSGYQDTFVVWGVLQGVVVLICAMFLKAPPPGWLPKTWRSVPGADLVVKKRQSTTDFTALEMAATPQFWLMYVMMAMVATGGLMATAQLGPMATDFKVAKMNVSLLGLTMAALPFALSADRLVNGLCRPFWGWISDHIGRENTMTVAFGLEACAIFILVKYAANPMVFVVMSAFTFFGWGEIYSLFPALCGDFFGRKYATTNYGFLYTAKGTASLFVPIGSALAAGKAFNFRADVLLIIGAALAFFALFLGPTAFRIDLGAGVKNALLAVAFVLVGGGIVLELLPKLLGFFVVNITMPNVGWFGVYSVAIVFDVLGALLAFFVLKRMKVPIKQSQQVTVGQQAPAPAHGD
jgi:OFA family oxalate/formate antiporter-like MFS transporter